MWNNTKRFLIMASVALNIAFVGVWLVHANPIGFTGEKTKQSATTARIWCPLHEQLNVSDEQWRQIEPRLKEFRESAQAVSKQINGFRSEVLDMIAKPVPDREAIAAKQDEIRVCQRAMQGMVVDHLLAEREILNDEQTGQLLPYCVSIVAVVAETARDYRDRRNVALVASLERIPRRLICH